MDIEKLKADIVKLLDMIGDEIVLRRIWKILLTALMNRDE